MSRQQSADFLSDIKRLSVCCLEELGFVVTTRLASSQQEHGRVSPLPEMENHSKGFPLQAKVWKVVRESFHW